MATVSHTLLAVLRDRPPQPIQRGRQQGVGLRRFQVKDDDARIGQAAGRVLQHAAVVQSQPAIAAQIAPLHRYGRHIRIGAAFRQLKEQRKRLWRVGGPNAEIEFAFVIVLRQE